eukprot:TRINITY_DN2142_c0_g1_i2.p1 TRINITY_DN2142_c0_g1~~TRINITY_DN2142_c0_g1_i2.p1  ORF type:complete len:168 (+),score=9.41 TRINITY_DN2142_c0_g1_i2:57-560(+)
MEAEEPFVAERTKTKSSTVILLLILSLVILTTIVLSVIYGIKNRIDIILAFLVLCPYIILVTLVVWYQKGDLSPKFRFLIGFAVFVVLLACVAAQAYIWIPKPPSPPSEKCAKGTGLYQYSNKTCYTISNWDKCLEIGACMKFVYTEKELSAYCYQCSNQTAFTSIP